MGWGGAALDDNRFSRQIATKSTVFQAVGQVNGPGMRPAACGLPHLDIGGADARRLLAHLRETATRQSPVSGNHFTIFGAFRRAAINRPAPVTQ
jgi:hypothetical protein